jgi:uncharacterized protein (TIGR03437 family)
MSSSRQAGAIAALVMCCAASATAQESGAPHTVSRLTLHQTTYRLRAGESTSLDASSGTLDFLLHAKTRRVEIARKETRGLVVAPNAAGDRLLLAASLALRPGEYRATLSATSGTGQQRAAWLTVTIDPMQAVPLNATQPPVILLNGFQLSCPIAVTSPASASTFGSLQNQLEAAGIPAVYFFDNCAACPDACGIEQLGTDLSQVIGSIQYTDGAAVPQVDLIAHSMGGLIVRSYLAGKQTASGLFDPPANPKVRKAVFIATPNFGAFLADSSTGAVVFAAGPQTSEMKMASQFLFELATWNQWGDDLRGVDALAIAGNASCCKLGGNFLGSNLFETGDLPDSGDGVVSLSSASIGFSGNQSRTRILEYCHMDSVPGCSGFGIANVDQAPETAGIVESFLAGTTAWMSIGGASTANEYLSQYGGLVFAAETAAGQYVSDLTQVTLKTSLGSLSLQGGAWGATTFYNEFISGPGTFQAFDGSLNQASYGPVPIPMGYYTAFRAKASPGIFSVGPLLAGAPGMVVQSGATVTLTGAGFGKEQCPACQVIAVPAGSTVPYPLTVSAWSDQAISASLPATFPGATVASPGLVTISVNLSASASDAIGIMAAPALAPAIAATPSSLQFSYTAGGTVPPAQAITVANSGGGTLTWSATASAAWLAVSVAAPSTLTVSASPAGLSAGTYTGVIQISAGGASNSPTSISVTLTVATATAAPFTVALSTAGQVEPFAAQAIVSAYGANLATGTASAASLPLPATLAGTTVTVTDSAGLASAAPLFYVSPAQVNFEIPVGAASGPATVTVDSQNGAAQSVAIQIGNTSPGLFQLNATGLVAAWVLPVTSGAQGALQPVYQVVSGSVEPLPIDLGPATQETYLEMYGTGIRNAQQVSATVGGLGVPVLFSGAAPGFPGEDQVNIGPLPHALSGQGSVNIVVAADGLAANAVSVTIQ